LKIYEARLPVKQILKDELKKIKKEQQKINVNQHAKHGTNLKGKITRTKETK